MIDGVSQCTDRSFAGVLRRCDARQADLLAPDAPQVTFVSGVLGPLIGADPLHLRDVEALEAGIASIGGAGTPDGIVLSGTVAAYLA